MLWRSPSHLSSAATSLRLGRRAFYLDLISAAATLRHLDQILAHAILSDHHPDLVTATKLLHRLADLGSPPPHLHRLFSSVPQPDLFLFNVLLRSLPPSSALSLLSSLPRAQSHLHPDSFTYAFAASSAAAIPSPATGRALHARVIIDGFAADPFVGSALTDFYLNFSQVSAAEKVFDGIPNPDTVLWNTLISGLVQNCAFLRSARVFAQMVMTGARFDSTTLAVVLPSAAELQELILGKTVHCLGVKSGLAFHSHIVTGLISMYSKCGEIPAAKFLFERIVEPDLIACSHRLPHWIRLHESYPLH